METFSLEIMLVKNGQTNTNLAMVSILPLLTEVLILI